MSSTPKTGARTSSFKLFALLGCSMVAGIFCAEAVSTILSEPAAVVEPGMADKPTTDESSVENGRVVMN